MKKIFALFLLTVTISPLTAAAQQNLINIPGASGGFDGYINAVYAMFISIAALLAVVKVIVAGVKYMFSDVVTQKSEAKKDIQGALLGLVVVLAAVLILTVINPNLTKFDLSGISQTQRAPALPSGPPPPAACAGGGCSPISCSNVTNCPTWCSGLGGTHQRSSNTAATYVCYVPSGTTPPASIACTRTGAMGSVIQCGGAIQTCAQLGGDPGTVILNVTTAVTCS